MKILYFCLSLTLSLSAFGQLFPKVPDYKGNIEQVVEKRYGKEANFLKLFKNSYHSGVYSGWKYTDQFNKQSKLISKTNTFKGKVVEETLFQYEKTDNRLIEREITTDKSSTNQGNYTEYENFIGPENRIEKVNFWAFNSKECVRKIFLVEQNVEYKLNRLYAFTRQNINENGDSSSTEKCSLFYDSSGKLIRIERKDVESGFTTILRYFYNNRHRIDHYSVDYLVGLDEYGKKNLTQDVYFKYDKQGNWIKKYIKSGKKSQLEAKRRIKYF
jgi:hypothetical protein